MLPVRVRWKEFPQLRETMKHQRKQEIQFYQNWALLSVCLVMLVLHNGVSILFLTAFL